MSDVERSCGFINALALSGKFSVHGTGGAGFAVPAVGLARANCPAGQIVIFQVIRHTGEGRGFTIGVKVGRCIPPDIQSSIGAGISRGDTLQEEALITFGFDRALRGGNPAYPRYSRA